MIINLISTSRNIHGLIKHWAKLTTNVLFLRKTRLFVKSRYSRNRQWSKSIVYFGLWFNIVSVVWSIFYCYRYTFIFSHTYWLAGLVALLASVRAAKLFSVTVFVQWLAGLTWRV